MHGSSSPSGDIFRCNAGVHRNQLWFGLVFASATIQLFVGTSSEIAPSSFSPRQVRLCRNRSRPTPRLKFLPPTSSRRSVDARRARRRRRNPTPPSDAAVGRCHRPRRHQLRLCRRRQREPFPPTVTPLTSVSAPRCAANNCVAALVSWAAAAAEPRRRCRPPLPPPPPPAVTTAAADLTRLRHRRQWLRGCCSRPLPPSPASTGCTAGTAATGWLRRRHRQ